MKTEKKINILVVDDEKDVELLFNQRFRKLIKDGVINFKYVFSAEQAISYLNTTSASDTITMLLSDINMPGMSGFELLQIIRSQYPGIQVLMITAYGDTENINKVKMLGAIDLLSKPIDFHQLELKLVSNLQP